MVSFNIETLKSGANPPLQTSFIKFDVAIATFKNLVKIAVLKERLNKTKDVRELSNILDKTDMEKVG